MKRGAGVVTVLGLLVSAVPLLVGSADAVEVQGSYFNPLKPRLADGRVVQSCPDPSVMRGRGSNARTWFMYCTSNPLTDQDTSSRRLPMLRSQDLVHWTFVGSALPGMPGWADRSAKLWAPDVFYSSVFRRYYLTFAVTDTTDIVSGEHGCHQDPAIGMATSTSPTGPWRLAAGPLVPPERLGTGCAFASTIDPDVLGESIGTSAMLYYGGFRGGIRAQRISIGQYAATLDGASQPITAERRYEGANVVRRGDLYYLFVSSGSCCTGPMSGYGVFAGRSTSPWGPFVDQRGNQLTAGRVGGTPVLAMNGNRWIGPGHNSVFRDFGGQWWTISHAIDRSRPYFANRPTLTRRPPLLDPIDWVGGWPTVRAGRGASSTTMPAPAAQPTQRSTYRPRGVVPDVPGSAIPGASDEFTGTEPDAARWTWLRQPVDPASYGVEDGVFRMDTQDGQLSGTDPQASALLQPAPSGDYVVETSVRLDVPAAGCCYDSVQAGLVVHAADDRFLKLVHASIASTRVTLFAVRVPIELPSAPSSGASTVGAPGDVTWLRLVKRTVAGHVLFTAYSSQDGTHWVRGATWRHDGLGSDATIGLASMGGTGFTARFDYVRVSALLA
jgi:arabinan endo-1,5-alpha-L-arabinosidase